MGQTLGQFEILEILGEGSFGTVCVARLSDDPLRRQVALKILKETYSTNKKILNRTRDEARLLSLISHPNIVRVEGLTSVDGRPVLVMEHVKGVSLDRLIGHFRDGLPISVVLEIIRQTSQALHVAYHETSREDGRPMRVIHRDIKPSNILLSIHGEVKVCDFGIAKGDFEGREAETESVVMGSRPYMAPERLDGVSDSPAVDAYSLGMSLFELATGKTMTLSINPINHRQALDRQIAYVKPKGMSEAVQSDLRSLINRLCAYDRKERPSAIEVIRDLEQCIFSLDDASRIDLSDFARDSVLPLYEGRTKVLPSKQFLDDASTTALPAPVALSGANRVFDRISESRMSIGVFSSFIIALLVLLSVLVGLKVHHQGGDLPSHYVTVRLWFPSHVSASVNGESITAPGVLSVSAGVQEAVFSFEDRPSIRCSFVATDGIAIRYVVDAGRAGLSIDDGLFLACERAQD